MGKIIFNAKGEGFSLLELVIALGILSVGTLFLSSLSVSTLKANTLSKNKTAALQLAQEKIETLKTLTFSELKGEVETGLKIGTMGTVFQRETTVQKGAGSLLAYVAVRVSWPNPSNQKQGHFTELTTRIAG